MNVAVLRSIKPYWVYLICEGKKTIEIGKNRPRSEYWNKRTYIYCSKDIKSFNRIPEEYREKYRQLLGKIIGEFVCVKVDRITHCGTCKRDINLKIVDENLCYKELNYTYLDNCKLSFSDIDEYSNGYDVYGWHISNLTVYTSQKILNNFNLTRPPQTWCYVRN